MNKTALVVASLMVVGPSLSMVDAAERRSAHPRQAESKVVTNPVQVVGTVQYDTGTNVGFQPDGTGLAINRVVGNRFNSALGGPLLASGMVTMLTVFPANAGPQYLSVASAPSPGNTLMVLYFVQANMVAGTFNQVAFPTTAVTADFVGLFMGTFNATQGTGLLGMSDMATMGQGYHALIANYQSSGIATGAAVVPNRNAMLRASGDILTPVELMDFRIQ